LTPILSVLLVHDLLLAKRGIAAPQNHILSTTVSKHKARLQAEFTRQRIRLGYHSLEALKVAVENGEMHVGAEGEEMSRHPRWVRVNRLRTSLEEELNTTFGDFQKMNDLNDLLKATRDSKVFYMDEHVPDLIALAPGFDLSKVEAYTSGKLIIQDKASCFPAYLLDVENVSGEIIDACAAPGNKTTQLAAFYFQHKQSSTLKGRIHAFEKDERRTQILEKMIRQAGADKIVRVHGQSNFLEAQPNDQIYQNVEAVLLDPSCSGSGIVTRDEESNLQLPVAIITTNQKNNSLSKKRKRPNDEKEDIKMLEEAQPEDGEALVKRLDALSAFQISLLTHAMSFSSASRIAYSTCSIHFEENERVVIQALSSKVGRSMGWKLLSRADQVAGMNKWNTRGDQNSCSKYLLNEKGNIKMNLSAKDIADACVRCDKHNKEGTIGFFVAGFIRDPDEDDGKDQTEAHGESSGQEEEWNGFSDSDHEIM
jgi:putative methyltransferase